MKLGAAGGNARYPEHTPPFWRDNDSLQRKKNTGNVSSPDEAAHTARAHPIPRRLSLPARLSPRSRVVEGAEAAPPPMPNSAEDPLNNSCLDISGAWLDVKAVRRARFEL